MKEPAISNLKSWPKSHFLKKWVTILKRLGTTAAVSPVVFPDTPTITFYIQVKTHEIKLLHARVVIFGNHLWKVARQVTATVETMNNIPYGAFRTNAEFGVELILADGHWVEVRWNLISLSAYQDANHYATLAPVIGDPWLNQVTGSPNVLQPCK